MKASEMRLPTAIIVIKTQQNMNSVGLSVTNVRLFRVTDLTLLVIEPECLLQFFGHSLGVVLNNELGGQCDELLKLQHARLCRSEAETLSSVILLIFCID